MSAIDSPPLKRPTSLFKAKATTRREAEAKKLRIRHDILWRLLLDRGLMSLGVILVLAGIGYLVAHNWNHLSSSEKLLLSAGTVAIVLAAATWAGFDRFLGKLLLLAASVLVGGYIVVCGQIYQTGADTYELFAVWALLIIPWVFMGRFMPLLMFWLSLFNIAQILYWPVSAFFTPLEGHLIFRYQTIGVVLSNGAALFLREWAAQTRSRQLYWLDRGWSAPVLLAATLIPASMETINEIGSDEGNNAFIAYMLYATCAIGLGLYYGRVRYSRTALTIITIGAYAVLTALTARTLGIGQPPSVWIWMDAGVIAFIIFSAGIFYLNTQQLLRGIEEISYHQSSPPWYKCGVNIGAWLASMLSITLFIILIGPQPQVTMGLIGVAFLIIAVAAGRQSWGLFVGQCSLAVSLIAQGMIYCGFVDGRHHPFATAALLSVLQASVLYLVYPNFFSRAINSLIALQLVLAWLYAGSKEYFSIPLHTQASLPPILPLYWALHLAAIYWCFLKFPHSRTLTPLGLALIASLSTWQVGYWRKVWIPLSGIDLYLQTGLTALALFGASIWAAGGISVLRRKAPLFAALALALTALAWLGSGGVLLALLIMLLGFLLQNRPILWLGILLFPIAFCCYYDFNLDLLAKSGVLIGSGVAMLLLRAARVRWVFAQIRDSL